MIVDLLSDDMLLWCVAPAWWLFSAFQLTSRGSVRRISLYINTCSRLFGYARHLRGRDRNYLGMTRTPWSIVNTIFGNWTLHCHLRCLKSMRFGPHWPLYSGCCLGELVVGRPCCSHRRCSQRQPKMMPSRQRYFSFSWAMYMGLTSESAQQRTPGEAVSVDNFNTLDSMVDMIQSEVFPC